jgi:hypothetical protein
MVSLKGNTQNETPKPALPLVMGNDKHQEDNPEDSSHDLDQCLHSFLPVKEYRYISVNNPSPPFITKPLTNGDHGLFPKSVVVSPVERGEYE